MGETLIILLGIVLSLTLLLAFLTPKLLNEKKVKEGDQILINSKCPICQCQLTIKRKGLQPLSTFEMGLVVQQRPDMHNQPLSEHRCPSCSASLIFYMGDRRPQFVISNVGENQSESSQCTQCHKRLLKPHWNPSQYQTDFSEAPLQIEHGLICSRCDAVCCLGCVTDATRNRTDDGSYLCPRCHRGPVDSIFYF